MADCIHHWRIQEASGKPMAAGRCLNCGAERAFRVSKVEWSKERTKRTGVTKLTINRQRKVTPAQQAAHQYMMAKSSFEERAEMERREWSAREYDGQIARLREGEGWLP